MEPEVPLLGKVRENMSNQAPRTGHWMEEIIREAQARGDFADLPGKGKPLALPDSDPFAGPEADLYRILKENGVKPEWVELRRQIVDSLAWLRQHGPHPLRPSRIVETNLLIAKHNRLIPTPSLALPKLPSNFGLAPEQE